MHSFFLHRQALVALWRSVPVRLWVWSGVVLVFLFTSNSHAETTLMLRSGNVIIPHSTIKVGDVAEVRSHDIREERAIEKLDLDLLGQAGEAEISKRQLEVRILLAGFGSVFIEGPTEVSVRRSNFKMLREQLRQRLETQFCKQFACEPDRLDLNFIRDLQVESILEQLRSPEFEVELVTNGAMPLGNKRLQIRIDAPNRVGIVVAVDLQIVLSADVAVTQQTIQRGQKITPEMVATLARPITDSNCISLEVSDVVGQVAKRRLPRNTVLRDSDIGEEVQPMLRTNTLVDIVTTIGAAEIRLRDAKLLAPARIGERARFRNTKTGLEFAATLVSPSLAKVTLVR